MMDEQLKQAALDFHEFLVAGKVSVMLTKSLATQKTWLWHIRLG